MLWVSKLIIDRVVSVVAGKKGDPSELWTLIGIEFGLAVLSDLLMRAVSLADSLLGDRLTNHVSIRLMEHAGTLDLASFEDPVFYDKLERARRQTTARLGMLAQLASTAQIRKPPCRRACNANTARTRAATATAPFDARWTVGAASPARARRWRVSDEKPAGK